MEEIYDDILKFYFAKGFLHKVNKDVRRQFTGVNRMEKMRNYLAPFMKLFQQEIHYRQQQQYLTADNLHNNIWLFSDLSCSLCIF